MQDVDKDQQMMAAYLIHKHDYYKTTLLAPLKAYCGYENKSAYGPARWLIATDMCMKLGSSIDSVMSFLDNVNIEEMLK